MSTGKPIEQQTVKALSWQLLYGNYRPKLGAYGWKKLAETVGAPDFRSMDPDEDCPMKPLNDAVVYIDRTLGKGDGRMIQEITRASVDRWASMFKNLVEQLPGRPQKMLEIFCTEVHPYFLNDGGASTIVKSAPDSFVMRLDNGLLEGFKIGLIEGFCQIVGAKANIRKAGDEYHVTWEILEETPQPSKWALFFNATRLPFLTATLAPVLLGAAIAWKDGFLRDPFHFWLFFLTLIGAVCFHIGTNVINDYFDHTTGTDQANLTPTPFSGGSRVIQRGLMSPESVRNLALLFYAFGTLIGVYLTFAVGPAILAFGLFGFLIGYLYSAPPLRLVDRGVGELAIAIGFGPTMLLGAYWVQAGRWSWEAFLASLPLALLIAAVLYINEFPDKPWDAHTGKKTLITRLPTSVAIKSYAVILAATYLIIVAGVVSGIMPPTTLVALLTLPMGWKAFRMLRQYHSHPYRLIPANASTVFAHLYTSLLLFVGYVVAGVLHIVL
jgi:1,4-dihydroxy-2-naphthoate octaprenyltransferase